MDTPDPRTRHKVALNPVTSSVAFAAVQNMLLLDSLFALVLLAGKSVLATDVGVLWLLTRVLACGAVSMSLWTVWTGELWKLRMVEWTVAGTASILLFLRYAGLLTALYRLPSARVVIFVHFSTIWFKSLLNPVVSPKKTAAVALALLISFLSDSGFDASNMKSLVPAYGALALEALSSSLLEHTQGVLLSSIGQSMSTAIGAIGASIFAIIFYVFRHVLVVSPPVPTLSLWSLSVVPLLAFVLLQPQRLPSLMRSSLAPSRYFALSFAVTFVSASILGTLTMRESARWSDSLVAAFLLFGMWPQSADALSGSPYADVSRLARTYLKVILANPESRKIFYFLMLNMCYMLVQMLYGIWTNSLGLISDAIHMAFDCMAIGVGLVASVMAQWPPNEKFTYGYGRIETLSGFANGIFLILISIFIVFEAIQRLLDPPEMNTSQLLLVSSLGLAINLFGMFAMGGHHHGGHSHSHGHDHGHDHGHSHAHSLQAQSTDDHDHGSQHSHDHSHTHTHDTHADPHPPLSSQSHSHSHSHSHGHSHADDGPSPGLRIDLTAEDKHSHSETKSHLHTHERFKHLSAESDHLDSPITPNYKFGHDEHFDTHDMSAPNLHDHSHAHQSHEGHSHNMRGVFLHVMADTLGSVGVIVSTLLIQVYGWTGFDPIASLFIAVLIAGSVIPLVIDTGKVLALDLGDQGTSIQETLSELHGIEGLASYTSPRFWPKDSSSTIGSIRVQLSPIQSSSEFSAGRPSFARVDKVIGRVDKLLRSRITGLEELTIQVEEPHTLSR